MSLVIRIGHCSENKGNYVPCTAIVNFVLTRWSWRLLDTSGSIINLLLLLGSPSDNKCSIDSSKSIVMIVVVAYLNTEA